MNSKDIDTSDSSASLRTRAELAYLRFEEGLSRGDPISFDAFVQGEQHELRSQLQEIHAEFHALRRVLHESDPRLTVGSEFGDFRLIRFLGQGGMGQVWEAEQVSLKRRVALKFLPPNLSASDTSLERFRREAEAAARLNHEGIVAVYASEEVEGRHFIVQELVKGGTTLADQEAARDSAPSSRAEFRAVTRRFIQIAAALHAAHQAGVIHRDIKPQNILLTADAKPKIADFGLARLESLPNVSRTGNLLGTPGFMSPEQTLAKPKVLDRRTDIFSLGATFYQALTASLPFEAENSTMLLEHVRLRDPKEPHKRHAAVPRELSIICMRALEKRPQDRYATCAEFADELERWLDDRPILAHPPGAITRTIKWSRRHPAWAGLLVLVLVLSLTAGKGLQFIRKLDRERHFVEVSEWTERDPGRALEQAWQGAERYPGAESNDHLLGILNRSFERARFLWDRGPLSSGTASPDGRYVVIGGEGGDLGWFDREANACRTLRGHAGPVTSIAFHPSGASFATTAADGVVRIRHSATGEIEQELEGLAEAAMSLWFDAGGARLCVVAPEVGRLRCWETEHWRRVAPGEVAPETGFGDGSSFERRFLLLQIGSKTTLVDAQGREEPLRLPNLTELPPTASACSPKNGLVFVAAKSQQIFWDPFRKEVLWERTDPGTVRHVEFDSRRELCFSISSAHEEGVVQIWDLQARKTYRLPHAERVVAATLLPDSERILTASADGRLRIWDYANERVQLELLGHKTEIRTLDLTAHGSLLSTAEDGEARLWSLNPLYEEATHRYQTEVANPHLRLARRASRLVTAPPNLRAVDHHFLPLHYRDLSARSSVHTEIPGPIRFWAMNDAYLFVQRFDGVPEVLDLWSRELRGKLSELHDAAIRRVHFSASGDRLLIKRQAEDPTTATLEAWQLEPAHRLGSFEADGARIEHPGLSPDGRTMAAVWTDAERLAQRLAWRELDSSRTREWSFPAGTRVRHLGFSPDSSQLALGFDDGSVRLYDFEAEVAPIEIRHHEGPVTWAVYHPSRPRLLTCSSDERAHLIDPRSGQLLRALPAHGDKVRYAKFSPDGNWFLTVTRHRIRLWNADTGESWADYPAHRSNVLFADFSHDSQAIVVGLRDGEILNLPVDIPAFAGAQRPQILRVGRKTP